MKTLNKAIIYQLPYYYMDVKKKYLNTNPIDNIQSSLWFVYHL